MALHPEDPYIGPHLAAYRLGLLSRTLPMWIQLFRAMPEFEWNHADGVLLSFEQLSEALIMLAAEIPPNPYQELKEMFEEGNEFWAGARSVSYECYATFDERNSALPQDEVKEIRLQPEAPTSGEDPEMEAPPPGSSPAERLKEILAEAKPNRRYLVPLLDAAISKIPSLQPLYRLGAAIGRYWEGIVFLERNEPLPDFQPVREAVQDPPGWLDSRLGFLEVLAKGPCRPRRLLQRALSSFGRTVDKSAFRGKRFDSLVVLRQVHSLNDVIQEKLGGLIESISPSPTGSIDGERDRPRWIKEQDEFWVGELRIGNLIVRRVRHDATNVIRVLDTFEEDGWRSRIDDPLTGKIGQARPDQQRRHETLRSLNRGLQRIRFRGDGTSQAILWEWNDPPETTQRPPRHLP